MSRGEEGDGGDQHPSEKESYLEGGVDEPPLSPDDGRCVRPVLPPGSERRAGRLRGVARAALPCA